MMHNDAQENKRMIKCKIDASVPMKPMTSFTRAHHFHLTISTTNVQLSFYDRLYLSSPLMVHVGLFVSFRQDSTEEVFRKPSP